MKLQPLDLEDISEWLEKQIEKRDDLIIRKKINPSNPPLFKEIVYITRIRDILIDEIKQRLKSACEFWLKYKDKPEKFLDEHPEYTEEVCEKCGHPYVIYEDLFNDWLFKLVFKPVLEDDKK